MIRDTCSYNRGSSFEEVVYFSLRGHSRLFIPIRIFSRRLRPVNRPPWNLVFLDFFSVGVSFFEKFPLILLLGGLVARPPLVGCNSRVETRDGGLLTPDACGDTFLSFPSVALSWGFSVCVLMIYIPSPTFFLPAPSVESSTQ